MTDEEIKKALECCGVAVDCAECPLYSFVELGTGNCVRLILKKAYYLINGQQAEIERLEKDLTKCKLEKEMLYQTVSEIQTNAIKEFAERLKKECHNYYPSIDSYCVSRKTVEVKDIDNLAKEITEGGLNNG